MLTYKSISTCFTRACIGLYNFFSFSSSRILRKAWRKFFTYKVKDQIFFSPINSTLSVSDTHKKITTISTTNTFSYCSESKINLLNQFS